MRFEEHLEISARRFPQRAAIVSGGVRTSYAELHEGSERFALGLREKAAFVNGERCVVFLENRAETAVAIFGTLRAGGVFSVINPTTKADKLAYVLGNCDASVLVTQSSLLATALAAAAECPCVRKIVVVEDGQAGEAAGEVVTRALGYDNFIGSNALSADRLARQGIDIDLAMLVYTSGSTGNPKGVMMTHKNIEHAATSITTYLQSQEGDVVLSVLPLAFDYGLYQLLMCVKMGATLVLEKSFAFPQKILPLLASEKVTGFPLVPTMAALIVQIKNFNPEWAQGVRYLTNTAAALPPAHIAKLQAMFPQARIYSMYGMTES